MIFKKLAITDSLDKVIDMWNTGLTRLRFDDNFETFKTTVTIAASAEATIVHNLGRVPSYKVIVRDIGDGKIVDGDEAWTNERVYLQNIGSSDMTITVIFFL